ncbi:transposable element Tcb1 transposase [Trichonephila clavipes]|nr:transposable element Tcb1 transposase [Trichonephila clavipes]
MTSRRDSNATTSSEPKLKQYSATKMSVDKLSDQEAGVRKKPQTHQQRYLQILIKADVQSVHRACRYRLERSVGNLDVSEELGIAQSVIYRLWQQFQDDGIVSRCYNTGRPRVTTPNEAAGIYIYLAVTAKRNRRSTASDLSRQLSSATGTTVSRQTVYRRLGHIGLYARRPVRCVPLTATHCR